MKDFGIIQGSKEQAVPLIINVDTVYVHTNIKKLDFDSQGNPTDNLYEYNEIQYTLNECIDFVANSEKGVYDDTTLLENSSVFPEFTIDIDYVYNQVRRYQNTLYTCIASHRATKFDISKWKLVGVINDENLYEWSPPLSTFDGYSIDGQCIYNDAVYTSLIDGNVYPPTDTTYWIWSYWYDTI